MNCDRLAGSVFTPRHPAFESLFLSQGQNNNLFVSLTGPLRPPISLVLFDTGCRLLQISHSFTPLLSSSQGLNGTVTTPSPPPPPHRSHTQENTTVFVLIIAFYIDTRPTQKLKVFLRKKTKGLYHIRILVSLCKATQLTLTAKWYILNVLCLSPSISL